jgi:hypothetical protein
MAKEPMERLGELIDENEEPWKQEGALQILLIELDRDQQFAGEMLGCSASNVSYWKNKMGVGEEPVQNETGGGDLCVRCNERETPDNTRNVICVACLDYLRSKDSSGDWNMAFPEEVVNV